MIDKNFLKKTIKEFLKSFAKKNNFTFTKPLLLTRLNKDVLHIINFELPSPQGFNCNIAIQPLYYPSETINLGFGNRLNRFKTRLSGNWGYGQTEQEIRNDLKIVMQLLEENALLWFQNAGSPEGIVSFIENGFADDLNMVVGFDPFLKNVYLGFSYLYLNKYELADRALSSVIDYFEGDERRWVIRLKELINNVRMLALNRPNEVADKLNEFVYQTKKNLNLK